jgi:hypothetical protein
LLLFQQRVLPEEDRVKLDYTNFLRGMMLGGTVSQSSQQAAHRERLRLGISDGVHASALEQLGWSASDFAAGTNLSEAARPMAEWLGARGYERYLQKMMAESVTLRQLLAMTPREMDETLARCTIAHGERQPLVAAFVESQLGADGATGGASSAGSSSGGAETVDHAQALIDRMAFEHWLDSVGLADYWATLKEYQFSLPVMLLKTPAEFAAAIEPTRLTAAEKARLSKAMKAKKATEAEQHATWQQVRKDKAAESEAKKISDALDQLVAWGLPEHAQLAAETKDASLRSLAGDGATLPGCRCGDGVELKLFTGADVGGDGPVAMEEKKMWAVLVLARGGKKKIALWGGTQVLSWQYQIMGQDLESKEQIELEVIHDAPWSVAFEAQSFFDFKEVLKRVDQYSEREDTKEKERKAKEEADAKAKEEADAKAKEEAEEEAMQAEKEKAKKEADAATAKLQAKKDADDAKEADAAAKLQAMKEADAKAKEEADAKAKEEADNSVGAKPPERGRQRRPSNDSSNALDAALKTAPVPRRKKSKLVTDIPDLLEPPTAAHPSGSRRKKSAIIGHGAAQLSVAENSGHLDHRHFGAVVAGSSPPEAASTAAGVEPGSPKAKPAPIRKMRHNSKTPRKRRTANGKDGPAVLKDLPKESLLKNGANAPMVTGFEGEKLDLKANREVGLMSATTVTSVVLDKTGMRDLEVE